MKVKEYNQMIKHITRPSKSISPKKVELDMNKHVVDTLNKYEDGPDIVEEVIRNSSTPVPGYIGGATPDPTAPTRAERIAGQKQLEKYATQPDSRGTFQKLVKKDEDDYQKSLKAKRSKPYYMQNLGNGKLEDVNAVEDERFINKTLKPVEQNEDPRGVAFNPTTQLFTNKDRTVAFKTYDEADTWNKAINIKTKPKPLPTQATPEQVGALAARMERNRQQTGSDGRYDKPIIKKKKTFTAIEPVKINFSSYTPLPVFEPSLQDIAAEQNYQRLVRESDEKKNRLEGLETLLGRKA